MRARLLTIATVATAFFGISTSAQADLIIFSANMNQSVEVTHLTPPSPATGTGLFTFDTTAHTLTMTWSFHDLVGTATDAHIHCCTTTPGVIGGATVATRAPLNLPGFSPPAGVQGGDFTVTLHTDVITDWNLPFLNLASVNGNPATGGSLANAEAALLNGALAGRAYFNIHSTRVGGGEIAGFLTPVPEPGSLALLGSGLLGLMLRRRKVSYA